MQVTDFAGDAPAVLFVDDEPTSRKWFAREFGDEFRVQTAGGAEEALSILRERSQEFGVLVTDYRMPQRDGMKLLRAVSDAEGVSVLVATHDQEVLAAADRVLRISDGVVAPAVPAG